MGFNSAFKGLNIFKEASCQAEVTFLILTAAALLLLSKLSTESKVKNRRVQ
jgi:hypothetical protein